MKGIAMLEPALVSNGLAIYRLGQGEPVLFMPGPHRYQIPGDGSAQEVIDGLHGLRRQIISFDPPASGASTRPSRLSMNEMHQCADEALDALGIATAVDVFGHSMGGFTALAYGLEHPMRVRRLVLVGTGAGRHAYMDMPGALAHPSHPRFWGMALRALFHILVPCRAAETLMNNYIDRQSFVDQRHCHAQPIPLSDWLRPRRGRSDWHRIASRLNYVVRLHEIMAPTLVLCGRYDSQFPLGASQQIAAAIPNAKLVIFEHSNHFPFIEEPEAFWPAVDKFLTRPNGSPC
jgi:proline iminopeptidase